jgi:tRNA dimethylallyltransferase
MVDILVICGPTASGKTDFAHKLALENNGEIINCDSMQIYKELPILSVSPSVDLTEKLPYHLYNFHSITQSFSVAEYAKLSSAKIHEVINKGKLPIIVGGTGMYINALLYGYNEMPEISEEIRRYAKELQQKEGQANFFDILKNIDSQAGVRLNANDVQRSIRAFEMFKQTGKSIFSFQNEENISLIKNLTFKIVLLYPERNFLYNLCNMRLIELFRNGAIQEVKNVKENFDNLETSAMKAIGLKEISLFIDDTISIEKAIYQAQCRTRQYAKRQITWFKNQLKEKTILQFSNFEEFRQLKL